MSSLTMRRATAFVPRALRHGNQVSKGAISVGLQMPSQQQQQLQKRASQNRFLSATVAESEAAEAEVMEELPTNDNDNDLLKLRHSSAHVMAMAVQQIFKEAQVTIGPWIDNGFYYDFYFPETTDPETGETVPSRKLSDQDLKQIKKAMDKIIS